MPDRGGSPKLFKDILMIDPITAAIFGGLAGHAIGSGKKPEQIIAQQVDYDRLLRVIKAAIAGNTEAIVLLDEDFSLGLNKWVITEGNGSVSLSSDYAALGSLSAKLSMDAGAVSATARIIYYMGWPLPYLTRVGIEIWFATNDTSVPYLFAAFNMSDGGVLNDTDIWFSTEDNKLRIVHADGTLTTPAKGIDLADYRFHRLKYVFDLASKEYLYCRLNEQVYDLRDYKVKESAIADDQGLYFNIGVEKTDATAGGSDTYLGRVRLTIGEPNTIPANITS